MQTIVHQLSIPLPEDRVELTVECHIDKVVLTGALFRCTRCRKIKPASEFGLRVMDRNHIRNQPQCKGCR